MLATGELQSLAPQLDFLELAKLLRLKLAGEPFPHSFIHELNAYSAAPADLAPGTGQAGDGKGMAWYFYSPVNRHDSAGGAPRRNRQIGGGGERRFWHPEGGEKPILGPDSKPTGAYWRTLSYVLKINNPPGAKKSFRNKRLGWCMVEIGLQQQDGAAGQQWELCKVYRSPSPRSTADPAETSTVAAGAEDVLPAAGNGLSGAEGRPHDSALEGGAIPEAVGCDVPCPPAPPPALCDYNVHFPGVNRSPALLIAPASIHGTLAIMKKTDAASAAATVVMKLDGSSIPSAERMKEMADLLLGFESPVVVLSPMGDTADKILLAAWKALSCDLREASEIDEFKNIRELHLRTIDELGLDSSIVSGPLGELELHLQRVAMTKEMTSTKRDHLVSSAERMSTILFSAYLNELGKGTLQEWKLHTIPTFGSGGRELAAAIIGRDLGLREMQVWKDQEIFTCDPNVCAEAIPLPKLTFDEAAELGFFGAQSIQLAMECGMSVRIKNSFNPQAPGTLITKSGNTSKSTLSSISLKSNITILEIKRIHTLDDSSFVEKAISKFKHFEYLGISVDWVATNEDVWFTLVPSKVLSQELIQPALDKAVKELQEIATVDRLQDRSVISLIGNPQVSLDILGKALNVLGSDNFAVEKVPRGSPKVANVSLVVRDSAAPHEDEGPSLLFPNEDLIPLSVPACLEMTNDSFWAMSTPQAKDPFRTCAGMRRLPFIPPPMQRQDNGLIRVHRGVCSRLCLAISIFQNFEYLGISIDWMATSEGKMPLTLVPSKLLSPALDEAVKELQNDRSVTSLRGNAQLSPHILRKLLNVLGRNPVVVEKVSQGSSKVTKVSLVVHGNVAQHYGEVLRSAFFENERPIPVDSSAPSSSGGFSEDGISQISDRVRRLAIA